MILNVTPGINLNAVSGPISKSQINQLGQPVVTLSPGSVVAGDTNFTSLTCTDGVFPFFQNRNNSAPTDKKLSRFSHSNAGAVSIERVNDAYTVGTSLIAWTADNKCTVGPNTGANAAVNFGAPALAGTAGSLVEMLRLDGSNGNAASLRVNHLRHTTGGDWTAATMRVQHYVDTTPQGFIDFNPSGLTHALSLGTCTAVQAPVNVLNITGSSGGNNVGIGTTNTPSKLTVAGEIRLLTNGNALLFTDTGGSTPYMASAVDGVFYFTGTTAAGAGRAIFQCAMRSDTSPLQVNVPLKIGAAGAQIASVLYATLSSYAPAGIFASGGTQVADVTVTGVTTSSIIHVTTDSLSNNGIVIRAFYQAANTVRIVWINTTVGTVTLSAANYRVQVTNF